ncbi:MAG TPA: hypothetical protein VHA73_13365 [Acidimicrobiales bacterium]|jgi:hypothetical protein|nr:hypothetical protein [Acidimicrobiales bacterium]
MPVRAAATDGWPAGAGRELRVDYDLFDGASADLLERILHAAEAAPGASVDPGAGQVVGAALARLAQAGADDSVERFFGPYGGERLETVAYERFGSTPEPAEAVPAAEAVRAAVDQRDEWARIELWVPGRDDQPILRVDAGSPPVFVFPGSSPEEVAAADVAGGRPLPPAPPELVPPSEPDGADPAGTGLVRLPVGSGGGPAIRTVDLDRLADLVAGRLRPTIEQAVSARPAPVVPTPQVDHHLLAAEVAARFADRPDAADAAAQEVAALVADRLHDQLVSDTNATTEAVAAGVAERLREEFGARPIAVANAAAQAVADGVGERLRAVLDGRPDPDPSAMAQATADLVTGQVGELLAAQPSPDPDAAARAVADRVIDRLSELPLEISLPDDSPLMQAIAAPAPAPPDPVALAADVTTQVTSALRDRLVDREAVRSAVASVFTERVPGLASAGAASTSELRTAIEQVGDIVRDGQRSTPAPEVLADSVAGRVAEQVGRELASAVGERLDPDAIAAATAPLLPTAAEVAGRVGELLAAELRRMEAVRASAPDGSARLVGHLQEHLERHADQLGQFSDQARTDRQKIENLVDEVAAMGRRARDQVDTVTEQYVRALDRAVRRVLDEIERLNSQRALLHSVPDPDRGDSAV